MSELSRDLDRHLVWIEKQARELQTAVEQLVEEGNALMSGEGGALWDDEQVHLIATAIHDWAENCGRSIAMAHTEASTFCTLLRLAHRSGR